MSPNNRRGPLTQDTPTSSSVVGRRAGSGERKASIEPVAWFKVGAAVVKGWDTAGQTPDGARPAGNRGLSRRVYSPVNALHQAPADPLRCTGSTGRLAARRLRQAASVSGSSLALLEMLLLLAAVGGWGGWQLWSLRQEARRRAEREATEIEARRNPD